MAIYELTLVLDGKATAAKKKTVTENLEKIVGVMKGKVEKTEDWGVRDLAYQIKKSTSGLYLYFILEFDAKDAKSLMQKLRMEGDVLRYLLIRKEESASA